MSTAVVDPPSRLDDLLRQALDVRAAVHGAGMVAGIGLRAGDLDVLRTAFDLPGGAERLARVARARVHEALEAAGVVSGIQSDALDDAITEVLGRVEDCDDGLLTRKVAQGTPPEPGRTAWIEYPQNHRGLPFHELVALPPRSRRRRVTYVHPGQVIARRHREQPGQPGVGVDGEALPPEMTGRPAPALADIAGANTEVRGREVVAARAGACEEDAEGVLRVVAQVVVDRVVEPLPPTGVLEAHVVVRGDVGGAGRIASTGNVFVGAARAAAVVDGAATVRGRHVVVHGRLAGGGDPPGAVTAEGTCAVGEVLHRRLTAQRILVAGDCHFGHLEAPLEVCVDGTLRGGRTSIGRRLQVAGDLGTEEGGSQTVVAIGGAALTARGPLAADLEALAADLEQVRTQRADLESERARRADTDPFWARLVAGETPTPHTAAQSRSRVAYEELGETLRVLEREADALKRSRAALTASSDDGEDGALGAAEIVVGGALHTDVVFEMAKVLSADDLELRVDFEHEGRQYKRHPLGRARHLLAGTVQAYCEPRLEAIGARRAAVEHMFAGQHSRPSLPELEDKLFELAFTWTRDEPPADLEVRVHLCVRARDPERFWVRTRARPRRPLARVAVQVSTQGTRASLALQEIDAVSSWTQATPLREELGEIAAAGLSALDLLAGGEPESPEEGAGDESPGR